LHKVSFCNLWGVEQQQTTAAMSKYTNTKRNGPYHYNRSTTGTYWTDGPGSMGMRFDTEMEAEHFVQCMNDAWVQGRKTGRQDVAIAKAVELEPMKPTN
jgi:hypothetical protein